MQIPAPTEDGRRPTIVPSEIKSGNWVQQQKTAWIRSQVLLTWQTSIKNAQRGNVQQWAGNLAFVYEVTEDFQRWKPHNVS